MNNIQSLLEGANPWKALQSDAARLAAKWSKTGLLEGLKSEADKNNMSMILENQAKQLVMESSQTGAGTAGAAFTAGVGNDSLVDTPTSYGTDTGGSIRVRWLP